MADFQTFLTVRERVLQAVENALKEISPENGYSTAFRRVERIKKPMTEHSEPPQIYLIPDASRTHWRSTHHKFEVIPCDIWVALQKVYDADTEFNIAIGDIQRRLKCDLVDPTHPLSPTQDWAQIYITEQEMQPLFNQNEAGNTIGFIRYNFEYWRMYDDPRLWDNADQLVERIPLI